MSEKVTTMVLKVDLECHRCYKKVKNILCKFPQVQDQTYDEKQNLVTIKVVSCCPEKVRQKICCKGGRSITSIEIKVPDKPEKKPEKPKKPEKKPKEPGVRNGPIHPPDPPPPMKPTPPSPPPVKLHPIPVPGCPPVYLCPIGTCCGPCSLGYGGGPCFHAQGGPPPPCYGKPPPPCYGKPPPPPCCGKPPPPPCYGKPPPPCYGKPPPPPCYEKPPPPCYGKPVCDSYGGGYEGCYVSRCDYFSEENPPGCTIM